MSVRVRMARWHSQKYMGVDIMMHLTCTNMPIALTVKALTEAKENGIQNILALRGDPPAGKEWTACEGGALSSSPARHRAAVRGLHVGRRRQHQRPHDGDLQDCAGAQTRRLRIAFSQLRAQCAGVLVCGWPLPHRAGQAS